MTSLSFHTDKQKHYKPECVEHQHIRHCTMADIPIVDFSAYSSPDSPHGKIAAAKAIDNAFRSQGFVYLKNYGLSKEQVEQCFAWVS
jgi:hypothetical protein